MTNFLPRIVVLAAVALAAAGGAAQAALVISGKPTKNVSCSAGVCTATAKSAVMNAGDLTGMLASSDVTLASGSEAKDIEVNSSISWASSNRLSLDAYRSIAIEKLVTVAGTGALALTINDGSKVGTLSFKLPGRVTFWDLSSSLIINGASYTLVGDIATLAADIASNPSGNFALANNYDASLDGTYAHAPIATTFSGSLEGLGNTIRKLTIRIADKSQPDYLGFFRLVADSGKIENFALTHATVVNGARTTGILASINHGLITRVHVDGNVVAGAYSEVGGLVGESEGIILSSDSAGSIRASNGSMIGGLVGFNSYGQIATSHSTATVTQRYFPRTINEPESDVGGLVGSLYGGSLTKSWASGTVLAGSRNGDSGLAVGGLFGGSVSASISDTYSLCTVSAANDTDTGGLAGFNTSSLQNSYSTGAVGAGSGSFVGGLIGYAGQTNSDTYWDLDTSGISDPSKGAGNIPNDPGITGLTDAQLKSGLPAGFDPSIWAQNPGINNGYPYLIANPPP